MKENIYGGKLVVFDGPNGVGKTTLIKCVAELLENNNIDFYVTKEPTKSILGEFAYAFSENNSGISLACIVAADRYKHLEDEIIPMLKQNKIVIVDRYVLSSFMFQGIDGVAFDTILDINKEIIKPDLQIAISAQVQQIQSRLQLREKLTRFEKTYDRKLELEYLGLGLKLLGKLDIQILNITNNDGLLDRNANLIYNEILELR